MKISIPNNIGSDLRVLPVGLAEAVVDQLFLGTSKTGNPKVTVRYVVTSEMKTEDDQAPTTVGENVLETYSLQPQALWRLNQVYKEVAGENLPQGDYEEGVLEEMLNGTLKGTRWVLLLTTELNQEGKEYTSIEEKDYLKG